MLPLYYSALTPIRDLHASDLAGIQWIRKTRYFSKSFSTGNSKRKLYKEVSHNIRGDTKSNVNHQVEMADATARAITRSI